MDFNNLVTFMDREARMLSCATSQARLNHSSIQEKEKRRSRQLVLDHLNPRERPLLPKLRLISGSIQRKILVLILPVPMFRPFCAYFANRTTPLKIVIYLDGSHTRSALNFYRQRDSALGVCRKSMLQGFALKEKSAKFKTALVSIPQFFIHPMFVRSPQWM